MNERWQQECKGEMAVRSILHGAIGGIVGVVAVGVWAVNFDSIMNGDGEGGWPVLIVRILLCEAIPLATLGAFHAGIGSNLSTEATLRQLLGRMLYFCGGFLLHRKAQEGPRW